MRTLPHAAIALGLAAALTAAALPAAAQTTTLVTHSADGGQTDGGALYAEISADARWITYQSGATNIVAGDTNDAADIFLYDRQNQTSVRVSRSSAGVQGNDDSLDPALSLDGRWVCFFSYASNLIAGDTNNTSDVFVHDTVSGVTFAASKSSAGTLSNGTSRYMSVSGDGGRIAFESAGDNLVGGDTNGVRDIFVHDRVAQTTVRVSTSASGAQGDGESLDAAISPDGRFVAFESTATNLVPGDTNGVSDVFIKDLSDGSIVRVSVGANGVQGNGSSREPSLSDMGAVVSFESDADNLVTGDSNGYRDVFVHHLSSGQTECVSLASDGTQSFRGAYEGILSPDGGFIVYHSHASNLVADDTNASADIFLRDIAAGTTERVSIGCFGQEPTQSSHYPAITPGGRFVAFDTSSENLLADDTNGQRDIFLHDRGGPFTTFCPGDGSGTACPCGNAGHHGHGCENSAGSGGGTLVARGAVSPDTVVMDSTDLPVGVFTLLAQSTSQHAGVVFGDGVLCIQGGLRRLFVKLASDGTVSSPGPGDPSISARSASLGDPLAPGTTRHYQLYYRDPQVSFCPPASFNISNAVEVRW
jgi:hypothetical protein